MTMNTPSILMPHQSDRARPAGYNRHLPGKLHPFVPSLNHTILLRSFKQQLDRDKSLRYSPSKAGKSSITGLAKKIIYCACLVHTPLKCTEAEGFGEKEPPWRDLLTLDLRKLEQGPNMPESPLRVHIIHEDP